MKKAVSILIFSICLCISAKPKLKAFESIPFEMVGTYVVIKAKINNTSTLNLIIDSGLRNTIITELMPGDNISLNYSDVKDLIGLGGGNNLEAFTSNFNILKFGKINLKEKTVFVLKDDIFNLSMHTGTKINGLIGIDFFLDYIVEINYSKRRIRFYDRNTFAEPEGYEKLPMVIEGKKMFIKLTVSEDDTTKKDITMLIDTGAELNAWLQSFKENSVQIPSKNVKATIGQGFNGEITGKIGRLPEICFGRYCFKNPIVSFPDSGSISGIVDNVDNLKRDGTVGSQLLSRFNYFIDYNQKQFYFKPNNNFNKLFSYNIAGIEITQILPLVPQTEVWKVWEDSPAAEAGVLAGDQIIEVNGQKAFMMNINELKKIFETPSKSMLRLVVKREDKEISVQIDMNSKI
jgi:hypothetical protein